MKRFYRLAALVLALLMLAGMAQADEQAAYEAAMELYNSQQYEQAASAFEALGDYADSKKMLSSSNRLEKKQRYNEGVALYKAEKWEEAKAIFDSFENYENSKKYSRDCANAIRRETYYRAGDLREAGQLEEARELYASLGSYQNCRERVEEIDAILAARKLAAYEQECYEKAVALRAEGKLAEARDMFVEAGSAEGATEQIYEILEVLARDEVLARAMKDMERGQYADALVRFETLGQTEKAAEAREALLAERYEEADSETDPSMAYILFLALGDYQDSAARAEALKEQTGPIPLYKASETLRKADRAAEAAIGYTLCGKYKESVKYAKQMAQDAEKAPQFERAHILKELWQLEEANAIYDSLGNYSYAQRMGIERISAVHLRDDATSEMSETFTAPDGSTHRYRIFKGVPRWIEAEAFCRALGGHLATMTSEEENTFVYQFMRDSGFTTAYFGLVDHERDNVWEWITGEPVDYCPWDSEEPSRGRSEYYGMYFYKHKGTWNNAHFYEKAKSDPGCSFICEWDD